MKPSNYLIVAVLTLALSACGGGGSAASNGNSNTGVATAPPAAETPSPSTPGGNETGTGMTNSQVPPTGNTTSLADQNANLGVLPDNSTSGTSNAGEILKIIRNAVAAVSAVVVVNSAMH